MRKTVFAYKDYRKFLRDFYEWESKRNGLTYARFARDAGIGAANYLKLVIDGDRNLTSPYIFKFAKALKLDHVEENYFESLVRLNQASGKEERKFYSERLFYFKKNYTAEELPSPEDFNIDTDLSVFAVAAHERSVEDAVFFLVHTIGFAPEQAENGLRELITKEVLQEDSNGKLFMAGSYISLYDPKGMNKSVSTLIESRLQYTVENFNKAYSTGEGKFVAYTMTGPADSPSTIKKHFLENIYNLTEKFDHETMAEDRDVFHVGLQVLPVRKGK